MSRATQIFALLLELAFVYAILVLGVGVAAGALVGLAT